jgi:hypothetical protein
MMSTFVTLQVIGLDGSFETTLEYRRLVRDMLMVRPELIDRYKSILKSYFDFDVEELKRRAGYVRPPSYVLGDMSEDWT